MKYQLAQHGWPIGSWLIPVGTIIDASASDDWSRMAAGRNPPINAQALDQECFEAMKKIYPANRIPRPGPDVAG